MTQVSTRFLLVVFSLFLLTLHPRCSQMDIKPLQILDFLRQRGVGEVVVLEFENQKVRSKLRLFVWFVAIFNFLHFIVHMPLVTMGSFKM